MAHFLSAKGLPDDLGGFHAQSLGEGLKVYECRDTEEGGLVSTPTLSPDVARLNCAIVRRWYTRSGHPNGGPQPFCQARGTGIGPARHASRSPPRPAMASVG